MEANATTFALESSPVLYGSDPRAGIIAVEPLGDRVMELTLAGPGAILLSLLRLPADRGGRAHLVGVKT